MTHCLCHIRTSSGDTSSRQLQTLSNSLLTKSERCTPSTSLHPDMWECTAFHAPKECTHCRQHLQSCISEVKTQLKAHTFPEGPSIGHDEGGEYKHKTYVSV